MSIYELKAKGNYHVSTTEDFSNPFYGKSIQDIGYYSSFRKVWLASFHFTDLYYLAIEGHRGENRGHHSQDKPDKEILKELKENGYAFFVRSISSEIKYQFHVIKHDLDKDVMMAEYGGVELKW